MTSQAKFYTLVGLAKWADNVLEDVICQ